MKKVKSIFMKPTILLGIAAVLLLGSGVGSARAALTYYSDQYSASMDMSTIGVSLKENGKVVSSKTYDDQGDATTNGEGKLLQNLLKEDEKFVLGKTYDEKLAVENSGNIDTFVRVVLTKSWQDKEGKNVDLSPALIELGFNQDGWIINEAQSTDERVVLYYTKVVESKKTTPDFMKTIRISNQLSTMYTKVEDKKTIKYQYTYNGYTFTLDAEVDAVQTHNAKDAIKSAWGIDVSVNDDETELSLG